MKNTGTLQVTTPMEREVVMTRVFNAPCRLVFDGLTTKLTSTFGRMAAFGGSQWTISPSLPG